jgi:hypothetical protein
VQKSFRKFILIAAAASGPASSQAGEQTAASTRISLREWAYDSHRSDMDLYALWTMTPATRLRFVASNFLQQDWMADSTYQDELTTHHTRVAYSGKAWERLTLEMKF